MNIESIPFLLLLLLAIGFAIYRYLYYRKKKEKLYQLASPIFLMLTALGICVLISFTLFFLGVVK
jgi:hypothetical protein